MRSIVTYVDKNNDEEIEHTIQNKATSGVRIIEGDLYVDHLTLGVRTYVKGKWKKLEIYP